MGLCMVRTSLLVVAGALLFTTTTVSAQVPQTPPAGAARQGGAGRAAGAAPARVSRPPLFLKEEWKQTPANDEHPVTQQSIASPNLELKLYGPSSEHIQLTGRAGDESNPNSRLDR